MKGKFIVFEGLDGSGQTTQANLLKDFLEEKGKEVVLTKEPTKNSEAGRRIREILDEKEKLDPIDLQRLFIQDRREHLDNLIIPSLKEGKTVISDRYFFSTIAFGASDGVDRNWLIEANNKFLIPDLTFFLKVNPRVCVERIQKRGESVTLFEKEKKLTKVWETYKILPDYFENVYVIDGERSIEEIFTEIKGIVLLKILGDNIKKEV